MNKNDIKRFVNNLKEQAIANPVVALAATAAVLTSVSKVMEANTQRGYQAAHAKEIDRRLTAQAMKAYK